MVGTLGGRRRGDRRGGPEGPAEADAHFRLLCRQDPARGGRLPAPVRRRHGRERGRRGPQEHRGHPRQYGHHRRFHRAHRQAADDAGRRACAHRARRTVARHATGARAHQAQGRAGQTCGQGRSQESGQEGEPERKAPHKRAAAKHQAQSQDQDGKGQAESEAEAVSEQQEDIDATKAPLVEHLIELRRRLMWALAAIFAAFVVCFWFAKPIYNLLLWPYRLAAGVDVPIELIYTAPQEFFFTQVKLALFGAIFIAFPVIAAQLYLFVAPGLYRAERKAFLPFLIATPILFLLGAALVYFVAMPLAMRFFLSMQETGDSGVQILLTAKVSEYLSLIMTLILGFGICFQLPVLLTLLARAGLVTAATLKHYRKHAILGVFLAAACLTPPDPISQIALALPTLLLYEISIFAVKMAEKKRAAADATDANATET